MQGREDGGLDQAWGSGSDEKWPDSGYLQVKLAGCAVGQKVGKMVCGGMSRKGKEQVLGVWVWTLYFRDSYWASKFRGHLASKGYGEKGHFGGLEGCHIWRSKGKHAPYRKGGVNKEEGQETVHDSVGCQAAPATLFGLDCSGRGNQTGVGMAEIRLPQHLPS